MVRGEATTKGGGCEPSPTPSPQPSRASGGGVFVKVAGLPPESIHLPFESGPYRMAMALTTVSESAWFEIDARYVDEMAERRRLLAERHGRRICRTAGFRRSALGNIA